MVQTQAERDAIAAIAAALAALKLACDLAELADYGTTYVRLPLENARSEVGLVLATLTD